jgi:hypothetical protein
MPINMFFFVKNHWEPYFTDNPRRLLVGKPEGKRPLERPRRRWPDNIKMDLGEVEWGEVD